MPQMSPLNWLSLMITFILIFIWFNSLNYFLFNKNNPMSISQKMKKILFNWKW